MFMSATVPPRRRIHHPTAPSHPPPHRPTTAPTAQIETDVNTHFICFTEVNGSIYELDGRKASPINHGPSSPETLLSDACRVVKGFMERDEGEHRFTIVALAPTVEE